MGDVAPEVPYRDRDLWSCPFCARPVQQRAGELRCAGCDRPLVASSPGHVYPATGMGYQAAGLDEAALCAPARRAPRALSASVGPVNVTLLCDCLVVSRTSPRLGGGRRTWYPLHVRWWPSRSGQRPHLRVRLRAPRRR